MIRTELSKVIEKCNRGTKRKVHVENWKDNKNKRLRNSGNAYITRENKSIPPKIPPEQIIWKNVLSIHIVIFSLYKELKCKITDGRWLQISTDDPNILRMRKNHSMVETWSCYNLLSRKTRKFSNYTMQPLREEPIKISDEKKKDLLSMASYLPDKYAEFYKSICG